jgi:hypothetical protein
MRGIARDELRHAALAYRLAEWFDTKLDARARARVAEARTRALCSLEDALAKPAAAVPTLGLPEAAHARLALAAMRETLATGRLAPCLHAPKPKARPREASHRSGACREVFPKWTRSARARHGA